MMKFACVRSTNLAKALYFLQNTANRDDLTRKEIGSRLGDAIPETIAALKQIHSMCYGKSEIQSSDETTRLQEPLVNDLEAALNLAIAPTNGEKQIQVDTSMLKMAVDELQRLNRHQKHQAKRVVVKATELAQRNKSLAFLVKANMESRGDHALDDALSDDEYTTPDDMLLIVHNETHVDAEDTK
jgi:aspartate oxidase